MADFIRLGERVFYVLLTAAIIIRFIPALPHQPQLLIYLANELAGVAFILVQRKGQWATSGYAALIAFVGTSAPLLVNPAGSAVVPSWVATALMLAGAAVAIGGKLSLRRSFGLIAANRGVKTGGLYRFVRHPIYCGYIVSHVGFLLYHLSIWNAASYAFAWTMFWLRAKEEEKFLLTDRDYANYAAKVRHRLIPGLV